MSLAQSPSWLRKTMGTALLLPFVVPSCHRDDRPLEPVGVDAGAAADAMQTSAADAMQTSAADAMQMTALQITSPQIPPGVFSGIQVSDAGAHADLCTNTDQANHPNFPDDADRFLQVFCADLKGKPVPSPKSLVEFESLLGLGFSNPAGANGAGGNPGFVLTGHSSSLVGRFVSAINPRAILFTPGPAANGYVALSYSRGDRFVEVATNDPQVPSKVILYLVRFETPCSGQNGDCTFGDLLLQPVETGWQSMTGYESSALSNTVLDCGECHQPKAMGGNGPTLLRMQEFLPPYTHFFSSNTEGGRALLADFHAAHGTDEDYAGIPAAMIDKSDPALLRQFITMAGFGTDAPSGSNQPNVFDSARIEDEVKASAPLQPGQNVPVGRSATWDAIYANTVRGLDIAVPYHDVKVTDPQKLAMATATYLKVQSGLSPASSLPDIRDVFLDEAIREMGFAPEAGLDARGLFLQVCHQCHNSDVTGQISRANFNVDLLLVGQLLSAEAGMAVSRLSITNPGDVHMMPPPALRTITAEERSLMVQFLQDYRMHP
jgi:mono/diheme cytochrome c family protein